MKNFNCSSPNYLKKNFLKSFKQKPSNNNIIKYTIFKCHLSRSKKNALLESKISNSHNQIPKKISTKTAKVSPVTIHKKIIKQMKINSNSNSNSNAISSIINIDPRYYISKNISESKSKSKSKSNSKSISKSKSKSKSKDKNSNIGYSGYIGKFKNNNSNNNIKKINYIFSHGHINKKIIKNQINCLNKNTYTKKINIQINKFSHIHRRHNFIHKINLLSNTKTNLVGIGYSNINNNLNKILNKINSNNFKTTPSSGLNSTKSSKEKNRTKNNISNNSNNNSKNKKKNVVNNNYNINNNLLISRQLKIHMNKKKYNSMNKIKNILITNETNNNYNQNNKSSLINKNSIIPHLNKNISNLNNNFGINNYNFDSAQLSKSYMTYYKKKLFKTKTDMKVKNSKYLKKIIKNYYESINHNNISHNIFSIKKMSKTNTKFINHYKNFNFNKNIYKGINICNNNKKKNKSKNNSSILYSHLINNNFSYSTNSKNSKSHSNKKRKQHKFNNMNESIKKKGITGNNTKIINKIAKKYYNVKKNVNKNSVCIQQRKKNTKKKINNIINNNNKSVLLTKREKIPLIQSESINNNKTSNKNENRNNINSKKKYKKNNLMHNFESDKHEKKSEKYIHLKNSIKENLNDNDNDNGNLENLSISMLPNENYYLEESKKLSNNIIQFGKENDYKSYPKTNLSFYKIGRSIGHGAFGKVNIALHILSGHIVAIKSFNKSKNNFPLHKIKYEIKIMQKLRNNKRIVKLLEAFENEKYFFIIMENVIGGNLLNAINKMNKLSETISRNIFKQLIETIKYIHSKGIVHRDIKPDNILLNLNNNIKLCDFGVSKEIKKGQLLMDSCGTPAFIAPEILLDDPYDPFMTDIWSCGVVLYVMISGFFPFTGINEMQLHKHILSGKFPKLQNISNDLNDLIYKILEINPRKRITIDEILEHPWIKIEEDNKIFEENLNNINSNSLFTKAEKIIYFKLRRDYRDINNNYEGNLETFTYRNIDTDYQEENQNALTVSFVHTPYNSRRERDYDDDLFYDDVNIEKDIMKFLPKVNEMNKQYEINNNCDFDHGMIINKKDNYFKKKIVSSFNDSYLKKQKNKKMKKEEESNNKENKNENDNENEIRNNNIEIGKDYGNEYDNRNKNDNFSTKSNTFNFDNNAIKYVESFGYKKEYIIKSLELNELNHATATYYLKLSLNDD